MLKHHGDRGTFYKNCEFCNSAFSTRTVDRHYMKVHNYGTFECMKCPFDGNFPNELIDHVTKEHNDSNLCRCPACDKDHALKDIEGHYNTCIREKLEGRKEKVCEACGKLLTAHHYNRHVKTHLRKKILNGEENVETLGKTLFYYCDKCEMRFAQKRTLDDHVQTVHEKVDFKCSLCPHLSFKTRYMRNGHMRIVHSSDEKYECEVCHKRFKGLNHKKIHDLVHADGKFECKFCKKTLKTKGALQAHERYHTGEKPFKCEHCGNGYVIASRLRQHLAGAHKIVGPKGGRAGWKNKQKE